VVWGDRVFLTGGDERAREIFCWHAGTGELLWRYEMPASEGSLPEVTPDTGHAAPTAAADGERLFTVFSTGDVAAVDFEGRPLWSRSFGVPDNPYGHAASLLLWKDFLIVQFDQRDQARVTALDVSSGDTVWEAVRDQDISWSSPVLIPGAAGPELVLNGNPAVVSYDPLSGIELWRVDCMSGELAPSPAYAAGMVFAANEYARLAAISLDGVPSLAWEYFKGLPEVSSPVATEDHLFMANGYGIVTCLDRRSGALLWEQEFDEGFYASPVVVGDRVYLMDRSGVMRIFAAAGEFRLLGSPVLGEPSTATGAFLDGRIYLRGEHHLYCIGEGP
jgi:outer membrane protein assembly factor BamB